MNRYVFILTMGCLTLLAGCHKSEAPGAFRWENTDTAADSVSKRLDRNFFLRADTAVLLPDVQCIESIAAASDDPVLDYRAQYFRGYYTVRAGDSDRGYGMLGKAIEEVDSVRYPYTWHRLKYLVHDSDERTPEAYRVDVDLVDYFNKAGDPFMEAVCLTQLGNFVKDCRDPEAAFAAYRRADSLYRVTGFERIARGNAINMASAHFVAHDTVTAVEILHRVLGDPDIESDIRARNIAMVNLGAYGREREPLDSLYAWYGTDTYSRVMTYLAQMLTEEGRLDSALVMGHKALDKALEERQADGVALALFTLSHTFDMAGMPDSAFEYMKPAQELTDRMLKAKQAEDIRLTETLRIATREKMEAELARSKNMLWIACLAFGVFVVLMVAAWVTHHRMQRLRMARLNATLETEKTRRRLLATQIAVEEKDTLLSTVSREMSSLKESGEISPEVSGRIGSPIKAHLGVSTSRDSFIDAFAELHPDFGRRMRERYPQVKDYDVRLASLVALGLDNKQIAATLGIRHESVKQARWRLRSRMELAAGDSLEHVLAEFLRNL